MAAKQKQKKHLLRGFIIKLIYVVIVLSILVSIVQLQVQINAKQAQKDEMDARNTAQSEINEELETKLASGINDTEVAKIAREYEYVMPSERVYKRVISD